MDLERLETPEEVASRAADRVQAVLAAEPEAAVVLPAGATPLPLYAELVRRARAGTLDLSRAHLFQLDELAGVGPADPRGFHALLRARLLDLVPRLPGRDHLLDGAAADPGREIVRHARELAEQGGARLAVLGLGRNGHVAFNEPGSTRADGARVVELAPPTRAALAGAFGAGAPRRGLTLGLAELLAARELLLLVTGSAKAASLAALLATAEGAAEHSLPPAALLREHPRLSVIADREAWPAAGTTRVG